MYYCDVVFVPFEYFLRYDVGGFVKIAISLKMPSEGQKDTGSHRSVVADECGSCSGAEGGEVGEIRGKFTDAQNGEQTGAAWPTTKIDMHV